MRNLSPRRPFTFTLRTLLGRKPVGGEQHRQFWEVIKLVGTICFVFGGVASLLAYFTTNEVPLREERDALSSMIQEYFSEPNDRDEVMPREVYLGEYRSIRGMNSLSESISDGGGIQVVFFEVSVVMEGTVDEVFGVKRQLRGYQQRIRQTMGEVTRSASERDLADPRSQVLRGRILEKLNQLLGEDLFETVVFNNFRVYEG